MQLNLFKNLKKIFLLIILGIILIPITRAAPSYSDVGQNLTYVGMGENIELRAKWTAKTEATYIDYLDISNLNLYGMCFNDDGTILFVSGYDTVGDIGIIRQYSLSTAYDVSTGSLEVNLGVDSQDNRPHGVTFNNDGLKMYMAGIDHDNVYEYHLTDSFNISTATYNTSLDVSTNCNNPRGLAFNDDGTKMLVVNDSRVCEYTLSTAYDITTASYNTYFDLSSQDTGCRGISFTDNGTIMYIVGTGNDKVYKYDLSTAYDITTACYSSSIDVSSQDTDPNDIAFNNDGSKMYIAGDGNDNVYEYNFTIYPLDTATLYLNLTMAYLIT